MNGLDRIAGIFVFNRSGKTNLFFALPAVFCLLIAVCILLLAGCDKAPVKDGGPASTEGVPGAIVILNNLGETLSVAYPDGSIRNDVQLTGESPNDIISDSSYLYIVNSLSNSVLVLDKGDLSVFTEISVGAGKNPMNACIVSDGIVAVSCFRSGTVEIVDIRAGRVMKSIDLNFISLPSETPGIYGRAYPTGIAFASGKIVVCLANLTDYYGGLGAAGRGMVAVIDASDLSVIKAIELRGFDPVYALKAGSRVAVACAGHYSGDIISGGGFAGDGSLDMINLETLALEDSIGLNAAPFSLSSDGGRVIYASNAMGGSIPKIDIDNRSVDYIKTDAQFISSARAAKGGIYALDFGRDRLLHYDESGRFKNAYTVGDGPIAMLFVNNASDEEIRLRARFEAMPETASVSHDVTFDAASSIAPEGAEFLWDFGDGSASSGSSVSHQYGIPGEYAVTLAIEAEGQTSIASGTVHVLEKSPFASRVVDYRPATGQFTSNEKFNNPLRALGAPRGGGGFQPDNSSQVSLGSFGGSIALAFDHEIRDEAGKYDFIVFGNSQYSTAPLRFVEPGIVEISADGINWFVIPGSHLSQFPLEKKCMTYPGGSGEFCSYELAGDAEDGITVGKYSLWGYADLNPVMPLPEGVLPWEFYTLPDDALIPGIDAGTCGGDTFDIAWAVNPETGEKANLSGFRFLRITTAVSNDLGGSLGESSTEIDAVAEINNN